jgi:ATP-binding cassette subfamily B protein
MDKLLVLHTGKLREAGTHQQLLAARGIYFKLYQLQYKDQERAGEEINSATSQLPIPN